MKLFYTSPVLNVSRPNLRPALQTSMLKPQPSPAFQRVGMELSSQQIKELETKLPDIAEQFHDYGGQEDLLKGVVEGFIQFLKDLPDHYTYGGFVPRNGTASPYLTIHGRKYPLNQKMIEINGTLKNPFQEIVNDITFLLRNERAKKRKKMAGVPDVTWTIDSNRES